MTGVLFFALAAGGCVSNNVYVENGHDKADFRDLRPRDPPTPVLVVADFRVNGQARPEVNPQVFGEIVRVLQRTRVLKPVSTDPGVSLTVIVDNTVDLNQAGKQGFMTGLTEGLVGSMVKDNYRFTYTLQKKGGKPQTALYQHALITVSGREAPPSYGQPHGIDDAFAIVVKQSVLEFLSDIQSINGDEPVMFVPDTSDGK